MKQFPYKKTYKLRSVKEMNLMANKASYILNEEQKSRFASAHILNGVKETVLRNRKNGRVRLTIECRCALVAEIYDVIFEKGKKK